jgi:hypothetical protein
VRFEDEDEDEEEDEEEDEDEERKRVDEAFSSNQSFCASG